MWEENAKKNPDIEYEIKASGSQKSLLKVTKDSNLFANIDDKWATFEEYIIGEIVEAGGVSNSNVHVRLKGQSKTVKIDVDSNTLKNVKENLIYHQKLLRISGEKNIYTKATRSLKLLEIKEPPSYDETKLKKLILSARESWRGIDSQKWLKEIRGELHA